MISGEVLPDIQLSHEAAEVSRSQLSEGWPRVYLAAVSDHCPAITPTTKSKSSNGSDMEPNVLGPVVC